MRQQIIYRQYNPNKTHRYGLLLQSWNDPRFPYTFKAVPYAAETKAGDGPYYLESTIFYIKYLVISLNHLNRSFPHKYWGNKLASRSRHCRKGEEEYQLIFLTPKTERFSVQLVSLKRRTKTFAWHLTPLCYRPPDHCMTKQFMMVKKSSK